MESHAAALAKGKTSKMLAEQQQRCIESEHLRLLSGVKLREMQQEVQQGRKCSKKVSSLTTWRASLLSASCVTFII